MDFRNIFINYVLYAIPTYGFTASVGYKRMIWHGNAPKADYVFLYKPSRNKTS